MAERPEPLFTRDELLSWVPPQAADENPNAWAKAVRDRIAKSGPIDPLRLAPSEAGEFVKMFLLQKQDRASLVYAIEQLRSHDLSWDQIGRLIDAPGQTVRSWYVSNSDLDRAWPGF